MFTWFSGSESRRPVLLRFRSSKAFITTTVATAVFTDVFVYAVPVPTLPFALTTRANVDESDIQKWISVFLAAYSAALLAASPVAGLVADRLESRRGPMLAGLIALAASTAVLCWGQSIAVLIVGRVLQGISSAIVWSVGLALLVDTVGVSGVGQAMGYVGLAMSLAILLAPLLGGIVFAKVGYYAVFAMAFGLVGLDIFLRVWMIETKLVAGLSAATADTTDSNSIGAPEKLSTSQGHPDQVGTQESNVQVDHNTSHTIAGGSDVPQHETSVPPIILLLSSRRIVSALWCCGAVSILYTALDALLPLFVKSTFHWDSIGAGLIFLPLVVVSFSGPLIGHLSDKYGARWFVTVACIVACPCVVLLRLIYTNTMPQKILLCTILAILGTCLTAMITPMMAEITYAVEAKARSRGPGYFGKYGAYAQAYGLFNVAWAAGGIVGPILGGFLNGAFGWTTSTSVLSAVPIVTAIPAVIWTGGSIFKKRN